MHTTRFLSRLAFALAVALAPARAQQPGTPRADAPRHVRDAARSEAVTRRLKLTDAQREAIRGIRARHAEQLKTRRQALRESRRVFRLASRDGSTGVEQLRALHQAMAQRQFEQLVARRAMRDEIRAVLTPEQREEAARLHGQAQGRRAARQEASVR